IHISKLKNESFLPYRIAVEPGSSDVDSCGEIDFKIVKKYIDERKEHVTEYLTQGFNASNVCTEKVDYNDNSYISYEDFEDIKFIDQNLELLSFRWGDKEFVFNIEDPNNTFYVK